TPDRQKDEKGLFCPMVESSQYMVRAALRIPDSRLIRPNIFLKQGPADAVSELHKHLPPKLFSDRKQLNEAVYRAWDRQMEFSRTLKARGRDILSEHPRQVPLWVVTGRPYNLYDERLNLGMGRQLAKLGISALPMDFLDYDHVDLSDFPRMYWGLGGRILRVAKLIASTPNWFGVHMTNFSCGPDSFIEHFYEYILKNKPALILELDEHSAVAGMLTRMEAYQNVVKNIFLSGGKIAA
ncbi:MAG: acyl-CoA dehydratase activase-related protein, partial [Desulfonatronovibrionaceae bacterium]